MRSCVARDRVQLNLIHARAPLTSTLINGTSDVDQGNCSAHDRAAPFPISQNLFIFKVLVIFVLLLLSPGPPNITLNPDPRTLTKGAEAMLTCNASSPLHVKITWLKNGQTVGSGSELKINSFQNEDQGDYYCKFSTELATSWSKPALFLVKGSFCLNYVSFGYYCAGFPQTSVVPGCTFNITQNTDLVFSCAFIGPFYRSKRAFTIIE